MIRRRTGGHVNALDITKLDSYHVPMLRSIRLCGLGRGQLYIGGPFCKMV
ncbi:unnamed protein product [Cylicostephanus goldi]|uniref:Uncharacterized protein n=1 Tax=Cylicostephanus goldi TaxID=71465 RepID=A0A3P6RAF5_CYLGO|nr:unnamed protein product [Cylicostephanus goldi]